MARRYIVSALAASETDKDGRDSFKIELVFPELPNTRVLTLTPMPDDRLNFKMQETPNQKLAMPFIEAMTGGNKKIAFALDFIEKRLGEDFLADKIAELFEPALIAVDEKSERFEELYLEERLSAEERLRPGKMLAGLVSHFIGGEDEEPSKFSLFAGLFGFMRNKESFLDED